MGIRLRTKQLLQAGGVGAAAMLVVASTTSYFIIDHVKDEAFEDKKSYQAELAEYKNEAHANQSVIALKKEVNKGEKITESMVQEVFVPRNASGTDKTKLSLANISNGNYFAKTDMPKNTLVSTSVLYKDVNVSNDLREAEYGFIELPSDLKKDEYIDIRIQFPNGDDYVLLGKKKAKNILGVTTWIDIDEGEILTMSSAIVDAYLEGARIYALKYVDEHMQKISQMNYPVKANVATLISEDPNIVNRAKLNLEMQNRERLDEALENLTQEEKDSVVSGNSSDKAAAADSANATAQDKLEEISEESSSEEQAELVGGTSVSEGEE